MINQDSPFGVAWIYIPFNFVDLEVAMNSDLELTMLKTQVVSLMELVSERLGGANPYSVLDISSMNLMELNKLRKSLHEILYAPPTRT